ncbi:AsnC family transcriptional regulator [Frischella sp. Ac48]|uniref:Lrp/AsnC family transcriptional regulator n=1 Tax=Frischella sp. Ac48 TaxID=2804531 RepID=UPI001C7CB6C4|nr:AsnC family transcriptional regulator [Frischella sp. Ac48]MBX4133776.1 AsnC family transcriptional regulator [Frischella sp. Ac48]
MDDKDKQILSILANNSRLSWKAIGEKVFLTGQAVGVRVQQLQDKGIISKFTTQIYYANYQFITFYMNNHSFKEFEQMVCAYQQVLTLDKITGDGCYFIQSCFDHDDLIKFINEITPYARYKISYRLKSVKT